MSRRLWIVVALAGLLVIAAGWLAARGMQAMRLRSGAEVDVTRLKQDLRAGHFTAAGADLRRLHRDARTARAVTRDPLVRVAGVLPVIGPDIRAARIAAQASYDVLEAAEPMEIALPRLGASLSSPSGAYIDVAAVRQAAEAIPAVNAAVHTGAELLAGVDPQRLHYGLGDGVGRLRERLVAGGTSLDSVEDSATVWPSMAGADGPRTYVLLLQQDAEARGTGGIVGSYAVLRMDRGRLTLLRTASREKTLDPGPPIPTTSLPTDIWDLWGTDLAEWAGLNLSPHFPWTGQLVAAGWQARQESPRLDYVAAVDQDVFAALLAGTGPVKVGPMTVSRDNAAAFLSRDVYARYSPAQVDEITGQLVSTTVGRLTGGRIDLPAVAQAMAEPIKEHRLLIWAADAKEQEKLESLPLSGALPDSPGPTTTVVVNNGAGGKLDAYLSVHTLYDPGTCTDGVLESHDVVTVQNTAPAHGLPDYVTLRADLSEEGITHHVPGSNRTIVDIYGPVGAEQALTTVDGEAVDVIEGMDREHPVWRLFLELQPGQKRTIDVMFLDSVSATIPGETPQVILQPMAVPATAQTKPLPRCGA